MQSDIKGYGLVNRIGVATIGIRIGYPILKPAPFEVDMYRLVTQAVKGLTVLSRFGHLHDVASKLIALLPVKTDLILTNQRLVFRIVNGLSQVCLCDLDDQLGSSYDVMLLFFLNAQVVESTTGVFGNGLGKILGEDGFGAVPEANDTVAPDGDLQDNEILSGKI